MCYHKLTPKSDLSRAYHSLGMENAPLVYENTPTYSTPLYKAVIYTRPKTDQGS